MEKYSNSLMFAWKMAAVEAKRSQHKCIEKEHIVMGLCKSCEIIAAPPKNKFKPEDIEAVAPELGRLQALLDKSGIDTRKFRQKLREKLGSGNYAVEGKVHRSNECKGYFKSAFELSNAPEINIFHILTVILEDPGVNILQVFLDFGLSFNGFKAAIKEALKGPSSGRKEAKEAALAMINAYRTQLKKTPGILLDCTDDALSMILRGYDPASGTAALSAAVERFITTPLDEKIRSGQLRQGDMVEVDVRTVFNITSLDAIMKENRRWTAALDSGSDDGLKACLITDSGHAEELLEAMRFLAVTFTDLQQDILKHEDTGTANTVQWVKQYKEIIEKQIALHGGKVIKYIGSSIMAACPNASSAVKLSIGIQKKMKEHNKFSVADEHYHVRSSLDCCSELPKDKKIFSTMAYTAARLQKIAKPDTILITKNVFELIKSDGAIRTIALGEQEIGGLSGAVEIFGVKH
ncbi:MAG: hypothetical protein L7F77_08440 [Candidatus Magnetominusculus sp. LBB02]|nr:hypothetical protein [Candidatus Magnetominusculus sp. LBB02]